MHEPGARETAVVLKGRLRLHCDGETHDLGEGELPLRSAALLGLVVASTVATADLAVDLTAVDPGAAVRARASAVSQDDPALHDPDGVRGTYLVAVQVLGL